MLSDQAKDWYEHQKSYDIGARAASERVVGRELAVFAAAMGLAARALDLARASSPTGDLAINPTGDLAIKRKIGLATNAFNLLWSAWDAVLAGRYSAAANHWRSIDETCDLLRAIGIEPRFAASMTSNKSDVPRARRIIRDAMARSIGGGQEWLRSRQNAAKLLQPYSHVTFESTSMALGLAHHEGKKVGVLRPGGVPARRSLKLHASCLSSDALKLVIALTSSLDEVNGVQALYENDVRRLVSWADRTLDEELASELPMPDGEMELIILVASTDGPPESPADQVGIS